MREDGQPRPSVRLACEAWVLCWRASAPLTLVQLATALLIGLAPAAVAWQTKLLVDSLVAARPGGSALIWAAGLSAAGLAGTIEPRLTTYVQSEHRRRIDRLLQDRLYSALDRFQGLSRFESPRFLDKLRLCTQADGAMIAPATTGLFSTGRGVVTMVSLLVTLYLLSPVIAGIVLLGSVPTLALQIRLSRRRAKMYVALTPAHRRQYFYFALTTDARAAKEIRLLGTGRFFKDRLLRELHTIQAGEREVDRSEFRAQALLAGVSASVAAAGLLWAVSAAVAGRLSVGDVTAFVAAVAGTQAGLAMLVNSVAAAHHALLMFAHHAEVTNLPDDLAPAPARVGSALPALRHGIELRDVWFRYDDDHPWVLRGVDLTIPYGQATAIVGLNGAGKTTLVKLLGRLYDPTRGAIYWDGVDIRTVPPAELRQRLGVLFQDFMEYDFTAADNIGIGDLPAIDDRERVEAAAMSAGASTIVKGLPRGFDTLLSRIFFAESEKDDPDTGVALSGGQWQRLALARTFMRDNRDLLILDEPSAGLDAQAEYEIHRRLQRHRVGRTSLLISHRLSAIRDAGQIVVLADGRITEQGNHHELVGNDGTYARLFALQASGYATVDQGGEL
ncbi:ABC transporter ATP-binding protein [Flindersiella endophytica]